MQIPDQTFFGLIAALELARTYVEETSDPEAFEHLDLIDATLLKVKTELSL